MDDGNTGYLVQTEGIIGCIASFKGSIRGDENFGTVQISHDNLEPAVKIDRRMGFEAGPDPLFGALQFQRAGDYAPHISDIFPFFG